MSGTGPIQASASTFQFEAALEEIVFAYERLPWFRRHLDDAGVRPGDLRRPRDLGRVPPTRKAHYRANFPGGVIAQGVSLDDPFIVQTRTSGTAGNRLATVVHRYLLAERLEASLSVHPPLVARLSAVTDRPPVRYAAPNCSDVECAQPHTRTTDRILSDGSLVLPVARDLLTTPEALVDQAIEEIAEWRPCGFDADPTHLAFLVRKYRERGLSPPPACMSLVLGYTRATRVARRQIRAFFADGAHLVEVVGMSELGWLAVECPLGAMHLNTTTFAMELLVDNRPAEPGELAELVVTSIGDRLSPHIRYQTGDLYRVVGDHCCCGHPFPVVRHEGRRRDQVRRNGQVILTPHELDTLVGDAPWLDLYRFHQHDNDRFALRLIVNERYQAGDEGPLVGSLLSILGTGAGLVAERVTYIDSERSGKVVSCTSSVSAENDPS